MSSTRRIVTTVVAGAVGLGLTVTTAVLPADAHGRGGGGHPSGPSSGSSQQLAPRTHFTMKPDGSSGLTQGGEGIPNIDSVKKTIATYYGDPGTGIADTTTSPYIREMDAIVAKELRQLPRILADARRHHEKPAIVFDADDTTLWTYDMEVGDMKFVYSPAEQDVWVQGQKFPATPAMVRLVNTAKAMGFTVFGLTGRNDDQKAATVANLQKVGYHGFTSSNLYTKWTGKGASQQPSYITCASASCTTVEYKALTRKHIEKLGYTITLNVGDQWSDLQGGYAERALKLPNPTYYLPSMDLPGKHEPRLASRTRFTMKADGSSGLTQSAEGIPNIDSVKKTIATYYGDPGTGLASTASSPYVTEMKRLTQRLAPQIAAQCAVGRLLHHNPAIVLDADDTTLWTYDMEVGDMKFVYSPAEQDVWVQAQKFPATPGMVSLVSAAKEAGCTVVGLTGRNDDQKAATIGNLQAVGYQGFTAANYYTKWTGVGASQQPSYISCATAKCTTIEYKSQTRAHVESRAGGDYEVVANVGDQYSDLIGGHADRAIKLPNPTYYLP